MPAQCLSLWNTLLSSPPTEPYFCLASYLILRFDELSQVLLGKKDASTLKYKTSSCWIFTHSYHSFIIQNIRLISPFPITAVTCVCETLMQWFQFCLACLWASWIPLRFKGRKHLDMKCCLWIPRFQASFSARENSIQHRIPSSGEIHLLSCDQFCFFSLFCEQGKLAKIGFTLLFLTHFYLWPVECK